jgi:hypothetical protein
MFVPRALFRKLRVIRGSREAESFLWAILLITVQLDFLVHLIVKYLFGILVNLLLLSNKNRLILLLGILNSFIFRLLVPVFDADTSMLYIAGKGDGNIRYYEWVEEEKTIHFLSEYKSSDPLRGLCFLPKRSLQTNECEVARIYKVHPTFIEPISFKVPRKVTGSSVDYRLMDFKAISSLLPPVGRQP